MAWVPNFWSCWEYLDMESHHCPYPLRQFTTGRRNIHLSAKQDMNAVHLFFFNRVDEFFGRLFLAKRHLLYTVIAEVGEHILHSLSILTFSQTTQISAGNLPVTSQPHLTLVQSQQCTFISVCQWITAQTSS